jgi:group I intron endonuclease
MPRKEYTHHFIYKVTNIINNKFYIGMHSTNNLEDGYLGSGDRIKRSINKYGKENFKFEILEKFTNRELLKEREKELVNEDLLRNILCMNLVLGGSGGFISLNGTKNGRISTDTILREKYGDNFKSVITKNFYENLSNEDRILLNMKIIDGQKRSGFDFGSTFRNKKHKEESKKLIGEKNSIKQKGEKNSQYGTCWITNNTENKKIKKVDLSIYLDSGWIKGRKM